MTLTMRLAFEEFGAIDAPRLIILHGFFASSRNWRAIAQMLATSYHVYAIDMRNHGDSPHSKIMDYCAMTEDLLHFMNAQHLATATLLGHSMGGKIAMWFALNHKERVKKLIVVDIAPVSYQYSFDSIINALKSLPLIAINNRKQAEFLLADSIPELSYRQFLLQNLILKNQQYRWRINLDIFAQTAPNITGFPDITQVAPFAGSTLFIAGAESEYIRVDAINALFPQAILTVIAEAGHWVHVQQTARFISVVNDFLQKS